VRYRLFNINYESLARHMPALLGEYQSGTISKTVP
jgi:hypothetical protein